MYHYSQVNKNCAFQGCAKIVMRLHTAVTENPGIPITYPTASNFHEYHSDTSPYPPDIPQTTPGSRRCQQTSTDAARHKQTAPDTQRHWKVLLEYIWRCLLASVVLCWHLLLPGDVWGVSVGCLGGVWGMSGGCLEVSEWYSWKSEAIGCVWGVSGFSSLAVWRHNTILAQPWKAWLVFI